LNYDDTAIPSAYDAGRSYAPEVLEYWLRIISSAVGKDHVDNILDLGCGTGRYSAALAAHFKTCVFAIDPSEKMLSEARRKGSDRVHLVRGSGEAVPLGDGAVDLVFVSMVFHHFKDPRQAAQECHRVLRENGVLCLRAATSDRINCYPYVPFFPRAQYLMNKNLQSVTFLRRTFADAGFECVQHQLISSEVAKNWSVYAEKIAHRADSVLAQLSDEEFADGLAALRGHARTAPAAERVIEPIDFFVFRRDDNG
jgi:ubiquinone/menaquinone biosynthesis C-methylase UbiE